MGISGYFWWTAATLALFYKYAIQNTLQIQYGGYMGSGANFCPTKNATDFTHFSAFAPQYLFSIVTIGFLVTF